MKLFVPKLDNSTNCYECFCCSCCFEPKALRLVKDCWEPECHKSCSGFDRHCIKKIHKSIEIDSPKIPKILAKYFSYKILSHQPGQCVACVGSGLSNSADKKQCSKCQGTGICADCKGIYMRNEVDIDPAEHPICW